MSNVTQILHAAQAGDPRASEELLPLVYDELRRMAANRLNREPHLHTLQATALVHDVWIKIAGSDERTWQGREHFFAAAAEAMRRILVDRARRRLATKRGSGAEHVDLDDANLPGPVDDEQVLAMNEALKRFAEVEPREAELVTLRYFAGLTFEEAASTLGIAIPTAKQWWAYSRAWLAIEIRKPS